MSDLERAVSRLRRRLWLVLTLREVLANETRWCVGWGVGALVLRWLGVPTNYSLIGGVVGVILVAIVSVLRTPAPSRAAVAALLDARMECGGLLAASATVPLGEWSPTATINKEPPIRWSSRPRVLLLATSVLFVCGALIIPVRSQAAAHHLDVTPDVKRLEARIDTLREENIITPERADAYKQTLQQLQSSAAGDDPGKTWEALDAVDDATNKLGAEAGEDAIRKGESLARVEAMASALDASGADAASLSSGMRDLAAEANTETMRGLTPEARQDIEKNAITKSDLQQIAAAARQGKSALRKTLSKLGKGGLLDPKTLRRFDDAAQSIDRDALARFLQEHRDTSMREAIAACTARGGVERGRGDAPMSFGDQSDEKDARFKDQVLPPAAAAALVDSDLAALSAAEPDPKQNATASKTRAGLTAGSASAQTGVVLPRHRATVSRFFERKKQ